MTKLKLVAVLLLELLITSLQAQTMYVNERIGTQTAFTLNNIQKITFAGGNAVVQKTDNSSNTYALSGLRYLNFSDLTTEITENPIHLAYSNWKTYPNPVINELNIDLSDRIEFGTISILDLEGRLMQRVNTTGHSTVKIDLSYLSPGIYLCRYTSASMIQTVKIIKQ